MSINLELDIFLKKSPLSLNAVFSLLDNIGLPAIIKSTIVFDTWEYTNVRHLAEDVLTIDTDNLLLEHFTLTEFIVNRVWNCVLITSFDDVCLNVSFAVDIQSFVHAQREE